MPRHVAPVKWSLRKHGRPSCFRKGGCPGDRPRTGPAKRGRGSITNSPASIASCAAIVSLPVSVIPGAPHENTGRHAASAVGSLSLVVDSRLAVPSIGRQLDRAAARQRKSRDHAARRNGTRIFGLPHKCDASVSLPASREQRSSNTPPFRDLPGWTKRASLLPLRL